MVKLEIHYFLHGLIVIMIGLIGGYFFAAAINKNNGREVAWRVVHSGATVAGTMIVAIGAVINGLDISYTMNATIFWGVVSSTYALVLGMVIAAFTGQRGIGKDGKKSSAIWKVVYYLYAIGAVVSVLSIGYLIVICFRLLM